MSSLRMSFQYVFPAFILIVALVTAYSISNDPTIHVLELSYRIDQKLLLTAIGLFGMQQMLRCVRLSGLLPLPITFVRLQGISLIQFCSNSLLPIHLGSLTLPELLRREGVPRSVSWAAQTVTTALDIFVAAILTIGSGLFFLYRPLSSAWSTPLLIALALSYFSLFFLGVAATIALRRAIRTQPADNEGVRMGPAETPQRHYRLTLPFATRLYVLLIQTVSQVHRALLQIPRSKIYRCSLITVLSRLLSLALSMVICRALAPDVQWHSALAICLIMPFISAVGFHGVAGIGTSDAALAALLSVAGIEISEAVTVAILARTLHFFLSTLGGFFGLFCLTVPHFFSRYLATLPKKGENEWTN